MTEGTGGFFTDYEISSSSFSTTSFLQAQWLKRGVTDGLGDRDLPLEYPLVLPFCGLEVWPPYEVSQG